MLHQTGQHPCTHPGTGCLGLPPAALESRPPRSEDPALPSFVSSAPPRSDGEALLRRIFSKVERV
ncbi:hypothetical protein JQX13_10545 [Archangium violaceum]|uniref:hypothetical protein n=1 Tax=Archangium violaceum TaxID=83451 RepID=UPI00193BAC43|nr:hypothetical protein [Archangium violaceum]QRK10484.1 hypothetical protein JQX13_10545 [Archangium violaceum]